ncbi:NADH-dependent dehydrogenase [Bacteroidia bacterium]|nr:NADH-dependent dehydrogenase [Bacteroidia bacterium]
MNARDLNTMSRRRFLGFSALGMAGLTILPSRVFAAGGRLAPSDRVVMGFIGLGQQGLSDFKSFTSCPGVQVVACCDVDSIKRERFKRRVEAWQKEQNVPVRCDTYEFYEDLLARKDIDAVAIATPDHWHALITIQACRAKKDVYVQKPLAFTIVESLQMVKAVRENGCVLQVGSQQRSAEEFQQAIALIRSGALGHVESIYAEVGDTPTPLNLPEQPVPSNLNWNQWLGPLNDPKIHYHPDLCPPISLDPEKRETLWGAWRWYRETGNGYTADWGAHMFDIAQAAIGMDGSGPCEFIPKGYKGAKYLTMKYANGIVMTEQPFGDKAGGKGLRFNTDKGWLKVARGYIECSDKKLLTKIEQEVNQGEYEVSSPHMQNFIDSVRSRKNPIAPVEVGCSTNILCVNANIATELQRPVLWNPATLSYGDDAEAANHRLYNYQYRKPYTLY